MSTWWWLRKRTYFVFVMRELSSLFVAWYVLFLLLLVRAVDRGDAAYADFLDWADSPLIVAINVVGVRLHRAPHRDLVQPHSPGDGPPGPADGRCRPG